MRDRPKVKSVNLNHLPLPLLHLVVVQDAFGRLARCRRRGGWVCFSLAVVDAPVVVGRCVGRPDIIQHEVKLGYKTCLKLKDALSF